MARKGSRLGLVSFDLDECKNSFCSLSYCFGSDDEKKEARAVRGKNGFECSLIVPSEGRWAMEGYFFFTGWRLMLSFTHRGPRFLIPRSRRAAEWAAGA